MLRVMVSVKNAHREPSPTLLWLHACHACWTKFPLMASSAERVALDQLLTRPQTYVLMNYVRLQTVYVKYVSRGSTAPSVKRVSGATLIPRRKLVLPYAVAILASISTTAVSHVLQVQDTLVQMAMRERGKCVRIVLGSVTESGAVRIPYPSRAQTPPRPVVRRSLMPLGSKMHVLLPWKKRLASTSTRTATPVRWIVNLSWLV